MSDLENFPWLKKSFLNTNISKLPHSSLIKGSKGMGKSILAKYIAKTLLCSNSSTEACNSCQSCNLFDESTHPDFFINNDDEKILIDEIREMINFSILSSSISPAKVIVLNNCENMNIASQNAILKTLEEPNSNTYIILTSSKRRSLNQTIYSRCNKIGLRDLNQLELTEWVRSQGMQDFNYYDYPTFLAPLEILKNIEEGRGGDYIDVSDCLLKFCNNEISIDETVKYLLDIDLGSLEKVNLLIDFFKTLLKSKLAEIPYSGKFQSLNDIFLSPIDLSDVIDELNNLRNNIMKVSAINENHSLKYFIFKLDTLIKQ
ncbi:AAA family ATPase [Gammaproteobacteria bacterium]|nr:AAA family ATPase [Gammaproteobacteria bacterium]